MQSNAEVGGNWPLRRPGQNSGVRVYRDSGRSRYLHGVTAVAVVEVAPFQSGARPESREIPVKHPDQSRLQNAVIQSVVASSSPLIPVPGENPPGERRPGGAPARQRFDQGKNVTAFAPL